MLTIIHKPKTRLAMQNRTQVTNIKKRPVAGVIHGFVSRAANSFYTITSIVSSAAIIALLGNIPATVQSAEIDSFTERKKLLTEPGDAGLFINNYIHTRLERAIAMTNGCDREGFYNNLFQAFGGYVREDFGIYAQEKGLKPFSYPPLKQSIYGGHLPFLTATWYPRVYQAATRLDQLIIGADKVGHFSSTGHLYFQHARAADASLKKTLLFGHLTEKRYFGLSCTGAYSWADLSANYEGLLFWQHLLGEQYVNDSRIKSQYILCQNDRFILNPDEPFNISDYASTAWDETVNCNSYVDTTVRDSVVGRIRKVTGGKTCPLQPERCQKIVDRYSYDGLVLKNVLSPECEQYLQVNWQDYGIKGDTFEQKLVTSFQTGAHSFSGETFTLMKIAEFRIDDFFFRIKKELHDLLHSQNDK